MASSSSSCFKELEVRLMLALPPAALRDLHGAICTRLNETLMKYVPVEGGVGGVLVAYWDVKLENPVARILYEQPDLHCTVSLRALFFAPTPGLTIVGEINKVGSDHVGLLVGGAFNASVGRTFVPPEFVPVTSTLPKEEAEEEDEEEKKKKKEKEKKKDNVEVKVKKEPKEGETTEQQADEQEGGLPYTECWRSTLDPSIELAAGGLAALQVRSWNTARGLLTIFGSMLAPHTGPLTPAAQEAISAGGLLAESDEKPLQEPGLTTTTQADHEDNQPEKKKKRRNSSSREEDAPAHQKKSKKEKRKKGEDKDEKAKPSDHGKRKAKDRTEEEESSLAPSSSSSKSSEDKKKRKKRRLDTST